MSTVYCVRFKLSPPGPFGLPDGDRIVVSSPAGQTRTIVSPIFDSYTAKLVGYGTLPEYRRPEDRIELTIELPQFGAEIVDNFLRITVKLAAVEEAVAAAEEIAQIVCQSLSLKLGIRMSAAIFSVEDDLGAPVDVRRLKRVQLFNLTTYDLPTLRGLIKGAFEAAAIADPKLKKALLYLEHALLLAEFSDSHEPRSAHAGFSRALAFLQLYKALTTLLGERGVDKDYQRRFKELGLAADFWKVRIDPLYRVRNDNDVAHYSLEIPAESSFRKEFREAATALSETVDAYIRNLTQGN